MRMAVAGVCAVALLVTGMATSGTQAVSLSVEGTPHRLRHGYPDVDVRFRIAPPLNRPLELKLCQNSTIDPTTPRCRSRFHHIGSFSTGQTVADRPLGAGQYEALAHTSSLPLEQSNVVRFTVTDECGWLGVRGPATEVRPQPPVLAGAPYPCTALAQGPLELRSPGGAMLSLSGLAFFDAAWDDPIIPELPPIPNVRIELTTRAGNTARVRYRTGRELRSHVIRAQTYSVLVVSRGRNDIELNQQPKVTRVRVRRGAAVLVPVTHKTRTSSFNIIQFIHRRCRGRPFLTCASAIRVKRRVNTRAEYVARSTVIRAGQTRSVRYTAP